MRCLPLAMTRGPLLAKIIRESAQDPRRQRPCACCGAPMAIVPDRIEQIARCPACLRVQRVADDGDAPWRLTDSAAEALRRTKSWPRWL